MNDLLIMLNSRELKKYTKKWLQKPKHIGQFINLPKYLFLQVI
jgi:hypothetical protein